MTKADTDNVNSYIRKAWKNIPSSVRYVGLALLFAGISAYAFLALAARSLGPSGYAGVATLWTLVFFASPTLFIPLEQETARHLAASQATRPHHHDRGLLEWTLRAVGASLALFGSLLIALRVPVARDLLDDDPWLFASLIAGSIAYAIAGVVRGSFSGTKKFRRYGAFVVAEASVRLLGVSALVAVGTSAAGPFGLLIALAPAAAMLLVPPQLKEMRCAVVGKRCWRNLGHLWAASAVMQLLINAAPIVVKLSSDSEPVTAAFLGATALARIPLFLHQAVLTPLLPQLAGSIAQADATATRAGIRSALRFTTMLGVVSVAASAILGEAGSRLLFGDSLAITTPLLTFMTIAMCLIMIAMTYSQVLLAGKRHASLSVHWLGGIFVFCCALSVAPAPLPLGVTGSFLLASASIAFTTRMAAAKIIKKVDNSYEGSRPPVPSWA